MADAESADVHHWQNYRRARKFDLCSGHYHIHLCRDGHAGKCPKLERRRLRMGCLVVVWSAVHGKVRQRYATMEFLRFLPCLHVSGERCRGVQLRFCLTEGSFFVSCAVSGLNRCGCVSNVPDGHVFPSSYSPSSLAILWYVEAGIKGRDLFKGTFLFN